ncbi:unannotated protein [freshwater metagenome]|uniref:Unannotated protein n=1 Tax=freshwater metagenome TaxID=449393 RepID=A0A6J7E634_9ZZZZ
MTTAATGTTWPSEVHTLSIDIGGSGLKASVLDPVGQMTTERVRIDTPYPCPPHVLVEAIARLVEPMTGAHRASVGFPGLVRQGRVIDVPSLSRREYGGPRDADLAQAWSEFDLGSAMAELLGVPTKVVNDADMQGCAVAQGKGLEFVMTLGTGVGTAVFNGGRLLPHLELSHGPFRDGDTIDIALGNAARKDIGTEKWLKRVRRAVSYFHDMLWFDHLYVGGGNAKHVSITDIGPKGQIIPNSSGIIGGVRIWELHSEDS